MNEIDNGMNIIIGTERELKKMVVLGVIIEPKKTRMKR